MNYTQNALEEAVRCFAEPLELEIGSLFQAKAVEKIPNAQDGGVVTSLLSYVLDKEIIKGAIVVGKDVYWNAFPVLVTDSSDLKKYTGSIYFPISNRDHRGIVRRAIDTYKDIGIVVTPCELEVLGMGSNMVKPDEVHLKIGLFCLGSFDQKRFWNYVGEEIKREDIKRFEIDKDLRLTDKAGKTVFQRPIKESHEYLIPWCKKCHEFIPGSADLSIGAGPEKGTCAVYLQTERGLGLFRKACENGRLVVAEVPAKFKERFEKTMQQKR